MLFGALCVFASFDQTHECSNLLELFFSSTWHLLFSLFYIHQINFNVFFVTEQSYVSYTSAIYQSFGA